MSDADLIARALRHEDPAAFGLLVQRHQSAVRHFLRRLTRGDVASADDLAQQTFVTAWRTLDRFRGGSLFTTWLLGVAYNHWRNARRDDRRRTTLADVHSAESAEPAATEQLDFNHDLAYALEQLSAAERLALHLHFQQGLSHGQTAEVLDWPLGTVKTHLARGKEKLRHLLAAWNPQT